MPRTRGRRQKRRSNWPRRILILLFTAAAVYAAVFCWMRAPRQKEGEPLQAKPVSGPGQGTAQTPQEGQDPPPEKHSHYERKDRFYTILLSGVDDGNGGSDTNILVAMDAENGKVYGASIPRDSKAVINGKNRKINFAYNSGGMELLAETVSDQLGIPVDYTVLVDLRGFEALVNAIGGVDFYVPVNMDYDDPDQNLSIHFSKGMQHLDGPSALKVVRFRHNNDGTGYGSEDVGRMATQQEFLKAVAKKVLDISNITRADEFVKIFQQYVETDLTLGNLAWLGGQLFSMGADSIEFSTLPGEWKYPYIYLDPAETLAMVNEHLNPYTEDRLAEDLHIPSR